MDKRHIIATTTGFDATTAAAALSVGSATLSVGSPAPTASPLLATVAAPSAASSPSAPETLLLSAASSVPPLCYYPLATKPPATVPNASIKSCGVLGCRKTYQKWCCGTEQCPMCHKFRKSFHCKACVRNGDFGHSSADKGR